MSKRFKVYLTGGEGIGWALDADLATTRESLSALDLRVEFSDIGEADVIHCVREWPLLRMSEEALAGKRILCHIGNDLQETYEQACMIRAGRIGLWIPMLRTAERQLALLKQRYAYISCAVDVRAFTAECPAGQSVISLREQFRIPQDQFVISNFTCDSFRSDLHIQWEQKGLELFLEIIRFLCGKGLPVHVLLAGPRHPWLRSYLSENKIPFTFVGSEIGGDDDAVNLLEPTMINKLYHASDMHLITSHRESGAMAILAAAATRTPVVSTPVGLAPDVLESRSLFRSIDEGAALIERHIRHRILDQTLEPQFQRVMKNHVPSANTARFADIYGRMEEIPAFSPGASKKAKTKLPQPGRLMRWLRGNRPGTGLRIGFWHEFHKPPYGGGNQFLIALGYALKKQGVRIEVNRFSSSIHAHLCNSAWFAVDDFLTEAKISKVRMIHRVDGPIAIYRATDWKEDRKIYDLNTRLASATVYQSGWCFTRLHELGFQPILPVIIRNAVDGRIFHSSGRVPFSMDRKIRLISTAWSDNPKKGGPFFKWLEGQLDWNRFEYTFVGRTKEQFEHIRHVRPQASKQLARILRRHDIYVMASQHETCSNALIEALSCGLPVLYFDDGANGELTQFGGLPFKTKEEAVSQLDRLIQNYEMFRECIHVQSIEEIAGKYIELFKEVLDS